MRRLTGLQDYSDCELVKAYKEGRDEAFVTLFDRYFVSALRLTYSLVRDFALAEDLAQESFLRTIKSLDLFDETGHDGDFKNWIFKIARNLSIDELRKEKRAPSAAEGDLELLSDPGSLSAEDRLQLDQIFAFLDTLDDSYRTCFVYFVVDGCSYREIQKRTGLSFDEVKTSIRTVRRRIRRNFQ